jgi:hypothetical protein
MNEACKGWNWDTSIKEKICTSLVGETKKSSRLHFFIEREMGRSSAALSVH